MAVVEDDDGLASRLIDVWCADMGRKIPWAKAVQITAIVNRMSDGERDRLLRLGDEDGSCEMCGRNAPGLEVQLGRAMTMLKAAQCPHLNCVDGMITNTGPDPQFDQCEWCYGRQMLIDAVTGVHT